MPHPTRVVALAVLLMTASACGSSSGGTTTTGSGGGAAEVSITSPKDGASVTMPFTLKWDSTVPLGPADSSMDQVRVYVDGKTNDSMVVGANQFKVKGLSAGKHKVEIALQHGDQAPVGPKSAVSVTVTRPGASPTTDTGGGGYGY